MIGELLGAGAGVLLAPAVLRLARRLRRPTGDPEPVAARTLVLAVVAMSALLGAAAATFRSPAWMVATALFGGVAVTAAAVDLAQLRLPNVLTYPLLVGGLLGALLLERTGIFAFVAGPDQPAQLVRAVGGAALYGGWMLLVALIVPDGYGLGDVKLAAGIGAWLGAVSWLELASGVLIGQSGIVLSLLAVRFRDRRLPASERRHVPLGPALVTGAALALLLS